MGFAIAFSCVALALWTHRRALSAFFSLDDLVILEELHGLRPHALTLWRLLARDAWFRVLIASFGSDPFPYHLASWLVHGANVALLYLFVRDRGGSRAMAGVAAGLFGASRLHLSALNSIACVGDPLALGLTLGALLLAHRGGRAQAGAAFLFLGALMSKESVAIMPLVLLLPGAANGRFRDRLEAAGPLLVLGAVFVLALVVMGVGGKQMRGEAYAWAIGANVFLNLMTYTDWVVRLADPFPGFVSAINPNAWRVGVPATAALALLAVLARRVAPPPAVGVAWWLLGLLAVLPLLHHSYLYYLYVPLAGLAMACAGVIGAAERWAARMDARPRAAARGRAPRTPAGPHTGMRARMARAALPAASVVLVLAHGLHADRLLAARYSARLSGIDVPLDPELRRSEIARRAVSAVGDRLSGTHGRVAFLLPAELREVYSATTGSRVDSLPDARGTSMVAGALDDGRGLRVLVPNVDSVAFLHAWKPGFGDFELFSQGRHGRISWFGRGSDGFAEWGAALTAEKAFTSARQVLEGALSEFPEHAPLRFHLAGLHYKMGDSTAMRRELEELLYRSPQDTLSAIVRADFPDLRPRGASAPAAGARRSSRDRE